MTAAIIGLIGVVVGSIMTYLIQWLMARRQRLWAVEDSKVQHERALDDEMRRQRYERLRQKVDVISAQVGLKTTLLMYIEDYEMGETGTVTKEQRVEILRQIDTREGEVQSALMATGSEELHQLHQSFNGHFYTTIESHDLADLHKAWDAAHAVHRKMEALLDETLVK